MQNASYSPQLLGIRLLSQAVDTDVAVKHPAASGMRDDAPAPRQVVHTQVQGRSLHHQRQCWLGAFLPQRASCPSIHAP